VCALGGGGATGGGSFGLVSCGEVCVVCYSCVPQRAGVSSFFFLGQGLCRPEKGGFFMIDKLNHARSS